MSHEPQRFARVEWNGGARWVAFPESGAPQLLTATPLDRAAGERALSADELQHLRYLAPCASSKVLGLGRNYKGLVGPRDEYEEPVFFLKSPTSLCGHGSAVALPAFASKVWVEAELGIVIGRSCHNVTVEEAGACILGYTVGGDITAENIHNRDWHLARSKAIDGFAPAGPFLVTGVPTDDLEIVTTINGREYQRGRTSDRIQNDAQIVSSLSRFLTLEPWDLILTGTPAGATSALVKPGDAVAHRIDSIGELHFTLC